MKSLPIRRGGVGDALQAGEKQFPKVTGEEWRAKRKRGAPAFRRSAAFNLSRLARRSVGKHPTSSKIGGRAQNDDGDHANRGCSVACQFENRAHNFLLQSHLAPVLDSCRHSNTPLIKSDIPSYDLRLSGSYCLLVPAASLPDAGCPSKRQERSCILAFGPVPFWNEPYYSTAHVCGSDLQLFTQLL